MEDASGPIADDVLGDVGLDGLLRLDCGRECQVQGRCHLLEVRGGESGVAVEIANDLSFGRFTSDQTWP
jgi:hypothetical protein